LKDKVVIVTGASSGIGQACAFEFARHCRAVVIAARNEAMLMETQLQLKKINGNVLAVIADVSKEDDCKKLIQATVEKFGTVDVLICNAGLSMRALFNETELGVLKNLMDVNFWGTVYCAKYAMPYLLLQQGSLVGVSSIAGKKGLPGRSGYSASKFAVEGFLETVRTENLKNNLHVLVACAGFTATNIRKTSLGKDGNMQGESPRDEKQMMSADEVAMHIYKSVKKRKRDLILTTNGKLTVWLNKFFPQIMDKVVYNHMAKEPGSPFK
jgi:dehydrogenase/reductase SDR family member 7B